MIQTIILILGLVALWFGTELTVSSAIRIADDIGLSKVITGLTIVAIGTDLPEAVVAVASALQTLQGNPASNLIIGNAVGSAAVQITLVLGITGLAGYLQLSRKHWRRDGTVLLLSIAMLGLFASDLTISRIEGFALVLGYIIYIASLLINEPTSRAKPVNINAQFYLRILYLIVGFGVIGVSSHYVVQSSLQLATLWGLQQTIFGIFIVGLGTSLPELAVAISAVTRKSASLSVGNIIGSNIFDTLVPVGIASMIVPMSIDRSNIVMHIPVLAVVTTVALFFFRRTKGIQKREAVILIVLFCVYATANLLTQ